ncbi:MAG: MarR family transcriptional regulator [Lentisphaerae bacterium]|nr:MarR family transcriptional regulator [Lentisphaerota bacterium]
MNEDMIRELRRNLRFSERRIKEFCAKQVPAEIFHYTLSQMRAIDMLYTLTRDTGNGIQLKVLAENLNITPAAASEMVDTLVRKGAIIRRNDPADRRAVRLYVGDKLREGFEYCENQMNVITADFLATLSAAEAECFTSVAEKFAEFTADPDNLPEVKK